MHCRLHIGFVHIYDRNTHYSVLQMGSQLKPTKAAAKQVALINKPSFATKGSILTHTYYMYSYTHFEFVCVCTRTFFMNTLWAGQKSIPVWSPKPTPSKGSVPFYNGLLKPPYEESLLFCPAYLLCCTLCVSLHK